MRVADPSAGDDDKSRFASWVAHSERDTIQENEKTPGLACGKNLSETTNVLRLGLWRGLQLGHVCAHLVFKQPMQGGFKLVFRREVDA